MLCRSAELKRFVSKLIVVQIATSSFKMLLNHAPVRNKCVLSPTPKKLVRRSAGAVVGSCRVVAVDHSAVE